MKRRVNDIPRGSRTLSDYNRRAWTILSVAEAHPFLTAFLTVVLLTPLCFGAQDNITTSARMIWCLIGIGIPLTAAVLLYRNKVLNKPSAVVCVAATLAVGFWCCYEFNASKRMFLWIFLYITLAAVILRASLKSDKKHRDSYNAMFIMLTSFGIKFAYVLYTSCYIRQNDVGSFDKGSGHAGYIEYLIQNMHLPDFRPSTRWQFYHPPFHHTVSAAWISICENVFGASRNFARESLQMLMLFYSMAAVIIVYKLLKHFGFTGKALVLPLALFAFHPAYILSAGAINNDQIANLLTVLTILLVVRWTKEPTLRNIIPIALSVGFAMMSKLNAALIAPAIAAVFLWYLAKNLKKWKNIFLQYGIFLLISVPIGLFWSVRNLIRWGMDPTYVPFIGESNQFVGDDIIGRLTNFEGKQFFPVFENWIRQGSDFDEYNPNVAILKNSLFGEEINANHFPGRNDAVPTMLFWLALVLALLGVVLTVWFMFRKNTRIELHDKAFMAGFWAFSMYYFYLFCFLYPNTCTQNFRYIYHLLSISAVQYAMLFDVLETGEQTAVKKWCSKVLTAAIIAFCILAVLTYLLVGIAET